MSMSSGEIHPLAYIYGYSPVAMPSNTSKKRSIDENEAGSGATKRARTAKDGSFAMWSRPSRSILPPERPGSIQSALASAPDASYDQHADQFRYTPLGPREFRLLRLDPGEEHDTINCSLVVDNVDTPSSYEAVSYYWGDPAAAHSIQISHENSAGIFTNSQTFSIGANLFAALTRIRMVDRPLILWVDALCIDQRSNSERSQQIPLMAEIYKKAHNVIAWLGEGTASSDWALSNLQTAFQPGFFGRQPNDSNRLTHPLARSFSSALSDIASRDYWKRIWVLQEMCLSRSMTFLVGKRQVCQQDLTTLLDLAR